MSKTVRFTDAGAPVVISHTDDGRVVIGHDFRTERTVREEELIELAAGHAAIIATADGKVRLYARESEGEDFGGASDMGFRLRFGPPASVRWRNSPEVEEELRSQPVTWLDGVRLARSGEAYADARPPVEFDVAIGMVPTLAGQLYQWLLSVGADVVLSQEP